MAAPRRSGYPWTVLAVGRLGSLARAGLLLGLATAACHMAEGPPDPDAGGTTATGDTEAVPAPAFLNPALGEFTVDSNQHVPKDITVHAVIPGETQLLLDGRTVGALGPGSNLGELTADTLRLAMTGALALGTHTLQLVTNGPSGPLFSTQLTMRVAQPTTALPTFRAELTGPALAPGDALIEAGFGDGALLGVLARAPGPALRLYLAEGTSWSATPLAEVPLAGHVPEPMSFAPGVAAARLPSGDVVRIAHTRGLPGDAIVTRDLALAPAPTLGPEETALDLSAGVFADVEFAAVGRPFLVGDALIAEFTAADDAELPHPGDRGLALVRRAAAGGWAAAQPVPTAAPIDLDATGRAVDLTDPTAAVLSVRVGRRLAGLVTLSAAGAALVSLAPNELDLVPGDPAIVSTLVTSLGGRVAATTTRARVGLTFLATTGFPMSKADTPSKLPNAAIAAPAALGVLLGYPVALVPYGDAAPVQLVLGDGARAQAIALTDPAPLHCDALVLRAGLSGNADDAPALPFACLSGGAVTLGVLTATAP